MSIGLYRLYVGYEADSSSVVVRRVTELVKALHGDEGVLHVISVVDDPDQAEAEGVIATPLLVRALPMPTRRIVGVPPSTSALLRSLGHDPLDVDLSSMPDQSPNGSPQ